MANNKHIAPSALNKRDRKAKSLGASMRQKSYGGGAPKKLAASMDQGKDKHATTTHGYTFIGKAMLQGGSRSGKKK